MSTLHDLIEERDAAVFAMKVAEERAEAAEARVAELEIPGNEEQMSWFRMLWREYGSAPDDKLAPSGLRLKQQLREIIGMDEVVRELMAALTSMVGDSCPCGDCQRGRDALAHAAALNLPGKGE